MIFIHKLINAITISQFVEEHPDFSYHVLIFLGVNLGVIFSKILRIKAVKVRHIGFNLQYLSIVILSVPIYKLFLTIPFIGGSILSAIDPLSSSILFGIMAETIIRLLTKTETQLTVLQSLIKLLQTASKTTAKNTDNNDKDNGGGGVNDK